LSHLTRSFSFCTLKISGVRHPNRNYSKDVLIIVYTSPKVKYTSILRCWKTIVDVGETNPNPKRATLVRAVCGSKRRAAIKRVSVGFFERNLSA